MPSENIFIGAENAENIFKGEIFDCVFITRAINEEEIKGIANEKQNNVAEG
jgi:hypothetical protein